MRDKGKGIIVVKEKQERTGKWEMVIAKVGLISCEGSSMERTENRDQLSSAQVTPARLSLAVCLLASHDVTMACGRVYVYHLRMTGKARVIFINPLQLDRVIEAEYNINQMCRME